MSAIETHSFGVPAKSKGASGKNEMLPALTGVRALAASMVFVHHYTAYEPKAGSFLAAFLFEMGSGVSIFFVLSGFLIYFRHSNLDCLGRIPLIRYCFHRFSRIYPMYFLVVVGSRIWIVIADKAYNPMRTLGNLFLQLTFIRGYSDQLKFIGTGQGWTLTVEVTFYALFPFLLLLIRRRGFLSALLSVYAVGLVLWAAGELLDFQGFFKPFHFVLLYTFFGRAADFFAGMFLASLVLKKSAELTPSPGEPRRWVFPKFTTFGAISVILCLVVFSVMEIHGVGFEQDNPFCLAFLILALPPAIAVFFYGLIYERTLLSRLLGSKLLQILGASSYCFYLIHVGGPDGIIGNLVWKDLRLGYLAIAIISIFLWKFVEEPLRRLILSHHLFKSTTPHRPAIHEATT